MRRNVVFVSMVLCILCMSLPCCAQSLLVEFICEVGAQFLQQGRYDEALDEFQKALIVEPSYEPALEYMRKARQLQSAEETGQALPPVTVETGAIPLTRQESISRVLNSFEQKVTSHLSIAGGAPAFKAGISTPSAPQKMLELPVIKLDEALKLTAQPIMVEQGKPFILHGTGIQRFLVTQPEVLKAEKKGPDDLILEGIAVGYTYVLAWDSQGRWTAEFYVIPAQPPGPTLEEAHRLAEEQARNFKFFSSVDWSTFESGSNFETLKRSTYNYIYQYGLQGPTPYGDIDASTMLTRFPRDTEMSHLTVGLTHGFLGPFKDFTARGFDFFDYPPDFSNLAYPGTSLRGGMFSSPAFNRRFNYTLFYGRENQPGRGFLSPSLSKKKDSFIEGANTQLIPSQEQKYSLTVVHGSGRDRTPDLNSYGYDFSPQWKLGKWYFAPETAYDSEKFAHLFTARYVEPRFNFSGEVRDINKSFVSITGTGWQQGERGGLFSANYIPIDALEMNSSLDIFQDRLFPALDNPSRWNEDLTYGTTYRFDPFTSLQFHQMLQNELGRVSQYRYLNTDVGLYKTIKWIRDLFASVTFAHQKNMNFTSPGSDYRNNRLLGTLRINLTKDIYGYVSREMNWLQEISTGNRSTPNAYEVGFDWTRFPGISGWGSSVRITYRNEQDVLSPLSFLPGEDYVEWYSELTYHHSDWETYLNGRARKVWGARPDVPNRVEASFNAGMRYFWDTGVSWQSSGSIAGYAFKDLNGDGIMQKGEPVVEGVKVWLGKKQQVTDKNGYFAFKNVKGAKAYVNIDTSTIPSGYILTVPATQAVVIENQRTVWADFGFVSRSEISGLVFEDIDHNGVYDKGDKPVAGALLTLEDGSKSKTDNTGRYSFPRAAPGDHTITLDLNSLPVYYLPTVPLSKKITLYEGVTYSYNIPLKRGPEEE